MKTIIAVTTLFSLLAIPSIAISTQHIDGQQSQPLTSNTHSIKWLGVSLQNISAAMHSQLGKLIDLNEGILIQNVQPNSPAQKAGLQNFDILTRFNEQKVTSTQQVYRLVQDSKENQETKLEVVRGGEKQNILVKIGTREITRSHQQRPSRQQNSLPHFNDQFWNFPKFDNKMNDPFGNAFNSPFFKPNWQGFSIPSLPNMPKNLQGNPNSWSQSESLSIQTLGNGKVRAELNTKDTKGNEKNFVFEDTRENVIKQIQEQKDLPVAQKQNLLNSLQGNSTSGFSQNFFNNSFFGNNSIPSFPRQNRPVY